MSTYSKITKHPQTGVYEEAIYHDDYFGRHIYGVEFLSDKKVYPTEIVESSQVYDFWADDVLNAFNKYLFTYHAPVDKDAALKFLNMIQIEYKKRWEEDPLTGNGATIKSATIQDL